LDDVCVATPYEDDIEVAEVLGMNILENFDLGINFAKEEIYASARDSFVSQKPKYQCGKVSLFQESELLAHA